MGHEHHLFTPHCKRGVRIRALEIQVAGLAGIPREVIERAQSLLMQMQNQKSHHPFVGEDLDQIADFGMESNDMKELLEEFGTHGDRTDDAA